MSFAVFCCLSNLLLFVIFFNYTSTYTARRQPKFVHEIKVEMVKTYLEQTYNLNTF